MCAPVSPPVVVVFVSNMPGWSCESVTTMTLAIVITVMAPGTHHQLPRDEVRPVRGAGSAAGGICSMTASTPDGSVTRNRVPAGAAHGTRHTAVVRPHRAYVTGPTSV